MNFTTTNPASIFDLCFDIQSKIELEVKYINIEKVTKKTHALIVDFINYGVDAWVDNSNTEYLQPSQIYIWEDEFF